MQLVRHAESDAWLAMGLAFFLSVLPLTKQLVRCRGVGLAGAGAAASMSVALSHGQAGSQACAEHRLYELGGLETQPGAWGC